MQRGRRLSPLLALALALAAGCDAKDEVVLLGPGNSAGGASDASAADPERDAGAGPSTGPDAVGGAGGEDAGGIRADERELDLLTTSALALLTRDCGGCHGDSEGVGGVGAIDDFDALLASGLIIPGNAAVSPLFESIRSGRMPPAGMLSRPSVGEQWLLEGFIEGLGLEPEACEPPPFPSVDAAYAAMLADVTAQPEADRLFIRYVSLTDAAGERCGRPLQLRRYALFEAVNGASLDPEIHVPVPIDASELLYRLDIRHYDWDRSIDVDADGSDDHADGWLALVAATGDYGVELRGPEADALRAATGATVPVLPGAALVWAASSGDVYYALIGAQANIYDTQLALGIDWAANMEDRVVRRAGFHRRTTGASNDVILERHPQSVEGRGYWSLMPQTGPWDSESIYDSAWSDDREAEQAIWQLPNGLLAFSIADQDGARLTGPPESCEECADDLATFYPRGGNPAGCHACHHRGLAPVQDEVLSFVQKNVRIYPAEEFEAFGEIYSAADRDALMAADNAVYLDALARAGSSPNMSSPISQVFLAFERSITADGQRAPRCGLSGGARNRPLNCPSGPAR